MYTVMRQMMKQEEEKHTGVTAQAIASMARAIVLAMKQHDQKQSEETDRLETDSADKYSKMSSKELSEFAASVLSSGGFS